MPEALFLLLVVCHTLADFVLTTPRMIAAKAVGWPLPPIALHAAVHAVLMSLCVLLYGAPLRAVFAVALAEWISHLAIDTLKGQATRAFPVLADAKRRPYWALFGLDQFCHIAVIVWLCGMVV